MEGPKILGISEDPTERDVEAVRSKEDVSVVSSLMDLIDSPENVKKLASFVRDEAISENLLKILTIKKHSDEFFNFLDSVRELTGEYKALEEQVDMPTRERFAKNLFDYLDKFNIPFDRESLQTRLQGLDVNFVDYIRYFGRVANTGINLEEAGQLGGYYMQDGDSITINMTAVDDLIHANKFEVEDRKAVRAEMVNIILRHELVHAASYRNYWITENEGDGEPQTDQRRMGVANMSFDKERNRLRWLNEAITERINQETLAPFSSREGMGSSPEYTQFVKQYPAYMEEQKVLDVLCEYVDWRSFINASFTKDGFLELGREIKKKIGMTLSELEEVMSQDEQEDHVYDRAIRLIRQRAADVGRKAV